MEEAKTKKISAESLETFITELFEKANMSKKDAVFHAKALVKSNLWGWIHMVSFVCQLTSTEC
ncbi:hypothetical protein [Eubacterium callanderi]|uniref:hypothetical protein n=1 Tax=Eubacterium callanderi TaxID=53442 RepID=UPI003919E789